MANRSFDSYILNRGWIDRSARRLPTYAEVTDVKKHKDKGKAKAVIDGDLSQEEGVQVAESGTELVADDDFDDLAEDFEASYNFRFEEP